MTWDTLFRLTNVVALGGWLLLAFVPRRPAVLSAVLYLGVALLCATYLAMFIALVSGLADPQRDGIGAAPAFEYAVDGLRQMLSSRGGTTVAWTHFLAFDLFVGLWIARDADAKGFGRVWQLPILFATFMAGPIGLLAWLIIREPASRRSNRARATRASR